MPLHVEYRSGVAGSEICRCRGNHIGGVEAEHEALRDLAVYERSDLRDNLFHELLLRPAVGLSLAPYRQQEIAFEKCRVFRERLRPAVPLHVDELVREVLVGAFLVAVSPYRVALRRRGLYAHLAVKQRGKHRVRIEVCKLNHEAIALIGCKPVITFWKSTSPSPSKNPTPRPRFEPCVLIL